jgi:uncharacterized membrane protein YedE/YeeE
MTIAISVEPAEPVEPVVGHPPVPLTPAERASAEATGLARAVALGSLVGVVLSFAAVLLAMLAGGYGWGAGVGLAAFTAFWGGLGFGSMVGGVIYLSAQEDH